MATKPYCLILVSVKCVLCFDYGHFDRVRHFVCFFYLSVVGYSRLIVSIPMPVIHWKGSSPTTASIDVRPKFIY